MSFSTAFYDTNIFLHAWNSNNAFSASCKFLVDTESIEWDVAISEVTMAESCIEDRLEEFFISCASQGITYKRITSENIKSTKSSRRKLCKKLEEAGMAASDLKQALAAIYFACNCLISNDEDFKSGNKKNPSEECVIADILLDDANLAVYDSMEAELLAKAGPEGVQPLEFLTTESSVQDNPELE